MVATKVAEVAEVAEAAEVSLQLRRRGEGTKKEEEEGVAPKWEVAVSRTGWLS